MALTGKKRGFADAVMAGKSNKDAAIDAGYSPATASAAGSRLVKDKDVVAYIKARKKSAKNPAPAADSGESGRDLDADLRYSDPKQFLIDAMNATDEIPRHQIEAAKALLPFMHQKLGEGGKKEQQKEAANKVASRFAPAAPPKLVAAGGKKV